MDKGKQLRSFIHKQKQLISESTEQKDRDYLFTLWLGFITGLRMTNAISREEYRELEREIEFYAIDIGAA